LPGLLPVAQGRCHFRHLGGDPLPRLLHAVAHRRAVDVQQCRDLHVGQTLQPQRGHHQLLRGEQRHHLAERLPFDQTVQGMG
jgi:hypothetical protein